MPPHRDIVRLFISLSLILLSPAASAAGHNCIDWPRTMSLYELDQISGEKTIVIQPFTDYTKMAGDEWLSLGIRDFLTDLLRSGKNLKVLSGKTAIYSGLQGPPAYTVSGMFQHVSTTLRIFISVTDGKSGQLVRQIETDFPYPEHKDFFTRLSDVAKQIMKVAETGPDGSVFSSVRDATSSTRAFESYSKGRQALESYSIAKAEIATMWFTDAKRIDMRSPLGYIGMIDLYTFLGFAHKQNKEPFATYFQKAEDEMAQMARFARGARTHKKGSALTNRFLLSNVAFTAGLSAAQAGDFGRAAEAFRHAVEIVPEDAISWYHLSRMETKLGNAAASTEALQKAYAINSCIEQ